MSEMTIFKRVRQKLALAQDSSTVIDSTQTPAGGPVRGKGCAHLPLWDITS
jgi:hypothetical protein